MHPRPHLSNDSSDASRSKLNEEQHFCARLRHDVQWDSLPTAVQRLGNEARGTMELVEGLLSQPAPNSPTFWTVSSPIPMKGADGLVQVKYVPHKTFQWGGDDNLIFLNDFPGASGTDVLRAVATVTDLHGSIWAVDFSYEVRWYQILPESVRRKIIF